MPNLFQVFFQVALGTLKTRNKNEGLTSQDYKQIGCEVAKAVSPIVLKKICLTFPFFFLCFQFCYSTPTPILEPVPTSRPALAFLSLCWMLLFSNHFFVVNSATGSDFFACFLQTVWSLSLHKFLLHRPFFSQSTGVSFFFSFSFLPFLTVLSNVALVALVPSRTDSLWDRSQKASWFHLFWLLAVPLVAPVFFFSIWAGWFVLVWLCVTILLLKLQLKSSEFVVPKRVQYLAFLLLLYASYGYYTKSLWQKPLLSLGNLIFIMYSINRDVQNIEEQPELKEIQPFFPLLVNHFIDIGNFIVFCRRVIRYFRIFQTTLLWLNPLLILLFTYCWIGTSVICNLWFVALQFIVNILDLLTRVLQFLFYCEDPALTSTDETSSTWWMPSWIPSSILAWLKERGTHLWSPFTKDKKDVLLSTKSASKSASKDGVLPPSPSPSPRGSKKMAENPAQVVRNIMTKHVTKGKSLTATDRRKLRKAEKALYKKSNLSKS